MTLLPSSPTAGKQGGQTKVSIERLQKFIGYVRAGLTLGAAARGIGITDATRVRWQRRGRLELVRLSDDGQDLLEYIDPTAQGWPSAKDWTVIPPGVDTGEWAFVLFVIATEKALAEFEAQQLGIIQRAAPTSWQAAAWLLERRFPELYGRAEARLKQKVEVSVGTPGPDEPVSVDDLEGALLAIEEQE